jgi:hypothetical protein
MTFQLADSYGESYCKDMTAWNDGLYGKAYAFQPTPADLNYLSVQEQQIVACGQSGPVREEDSVTVIAVPEIYSMVGFANPIASGSSAGTCNPQGNYVVDIPLALK